MKKRVLYICFIEYINNIGPLPGFPPLFYIFTIKKYKKNYKKILPDVRNTSYETLPRAVNGDRSQWASQNFELAGHSSASGSKGVAEHRSQRASVGVGIQGHGHRRAWLDIEVEEHPRARASKGAGI